MCVCMCVCACVRASVRACVRAVIVIVKRPVLPHCVVVWRSKNPLYLFILSPVSLLNALTRMQIHFP